MNNPAGFRTITGVLQIIAGVVLSVSAASGPVHAATFTVNSTKDEVDVRPGDGVCKSASGTCTLRAAIMEANALHAPGGSTITIPAGDYVLTITGTAEDKARTGDLDIYGSLSIVASGGLARIRGTTGWDDRIFDVQAGASVKLTGLDISNGNQFRSSGIFSNLGGAILIRSSATLTLAKSNVHDSVAGFEGGGIYVSDATLVLEASIVQSNRAGDPNIGSGGGGGISIDDSSTLTLTHSTVTGNTTLFNGAGLYNRGVAQLTDCTISGNTSSDNSGGIRNDGQLTITRCTLNGNQALGAFGGAIGNESGQLTMTNSTVSGNVAKFEGGGVDVFDSIGTFNNVTITANSSATGGGINFEQSGGTTALGITVHNSIVARNTASTGPDCNFGSTGFLDVQFSLVTNTANCILLIPSGNNNIFGSDPLLLPLQNNGGSTSTHALCTGAGTPASSCTGKSPAIDAASTNTPGSGGIACAGTDQRLVTRPQGNRCDMGSFESSAVGGFEVTPADAMVAADQQIFYTFRWTHPTFWRDIHTLQFRIVHDRRPIFWILWDQERNTVSLVDPRFGRPGPGFSPGSKHELRSDEATLDLEATQIVTSGPEGHDVTLILPLTFKHKAAEGRAGSDDVIEVAATDDAGDTQGFEQAATVTIMRH